MSTNKIIHLQAAKSAAEQHGELETGQPPRSSPAKRRPLPQPEPDDGEPKPAANTSLPATTTQTPSDEPSHRPPPKRRPLPPPEPDDEPQPAANKLLPVVTAQHPNQMAAAGAAEDATEIKSAPGALAGEPESAPVDIEHVPNSDPKPERVGKLEVHPLANVFPMAPKDELESLADSISTNGQMNPVVLLDGKILDGRRRVAACLLAGEEVKTVPLPDGIDPVEFVLAQNLHRRHLTQSQRATVAAKLMPIYREQAANRKRLLSGTRANPDGSEPEVTATLPERAECGEAREAAAKVTGAKPRYVSDAVRLQHDAPELFKQVESGELTIPQALKKAAAREDDEPVEAAKTRKEFIAVLWDERFDDVKRRAPEKSYPANTYPNIAFFRLGRTGVAKFGGGSRCGMKEVALFAVPVEPELLLKDEHGVPVCKASCQYLSLAVRGDVPEPKVVPAQVIDGGFEGVVNMIEGMWPKELKAVSTASDEEPHGWQTIPREPHSNAQTPHADAPAASKEADEDKRSNNASSGKAPKLTRQVSPGKASGSASERSGEPSPERAHGQRAGRPRLTDPEQVDTQPAFTPKPISTAQKIAKALAGLKRKPEAQQQSKQPSLPARPSRPHRPLPVPEPEDDFDPEAL